MNKQGFVYIMANDRPTFYVGVTSNLIQRVYQHKNNVTEGLTKRYNLHKLVYYETVDSIDEAINREKKIKDMNRKDKYEMILQFNPTFSDLYSQILDIRPE